MSASFLHFSRNEVEYVPKNGMELLRIGRDRIIFQYRPSIWAALTEYMPKDMIKRLDDVIRNERGGHFRRRPGACAGEPAAPWIEKKADSKKSGARIAGVGSCVVCCSAGAGENQYIPPMSGAAGAAGAAFSGRSATRDSVVRTMEETDAAFSSALRQTLVGSTMPFSIMSPKVSCAAS